LHKNNILRTHFYDKDAWLLHHDYYVLNDAFLEKIKEVVQSGFTLNWA